LISHVLLLDVQESNVFGVLLNKGSSAVNVLAHQG
jgi:hypothetical protein